MENRNGRERPDLFTQLYTEVPVSRRRLGIVGAMAVGRLLTDTKVAFAGGGIPIPEAEEVLNYSDAPEHFRNANKLVKDLLNNDLIARYGLVLPADETTSQVNLLTTKTIGTAGPEVIFTSDVRLYDQSTTPPMYVTSEFDDQGNLLRSRFGIQFNSVGGRYYIPELTKLLTPQRHGLAILRTDFDKALQTAFNFSGSLRPTRPRWGYGSAGIEDKVLKGLTPDGKPVKYYVTSRADLFAEVEDPNKP